MKRPSITLWLSLVFAVAAATVLLGVGHFLRQSVEDHFAHGDAEELSGKLELIRHLLVKVRSTAELDAVPQQLEDALVGHADLSVLLRDSRRRIWFAAGGADFPVALLQAAAAQPRAWQQGPRLFRGLAAAVPTGIAGEPPFTLAIALDTTYHGEFLDKFHDALWVALAVGALLMAVAGWGAAYRGLAPLRRMAVVARNVSANRLTDRLPLDRAPAELTELGAAFNDMLGRLEDSFRRLSDFSSDLAHELRTPISNLMTQTQVALSRTRSAEEYREVLYSNLEEYERLARMIADMLFLAQADHGLAVPHKEPVDLAAEVRQLIEFYEPLAEEGGVKLICLGGGVAPGDRIMIRRAIGNLLSNAIRFTPRGCAVSVTLEQGAEAVVTTVENPGPEIPPEHLPRIFDRFHRVDPSRHKSSDGAGLGLAITRSIIEAHGGVIQVSSGHGKTRFEFSLPRKTGGGGHDEAKGDGAASASRHRFLETG